MNSAAILDLVAALYDDKVGSDPKAWDGLCQIDGSYSALKRVDGLDVLIWRGSTTPLDWRQDFQDLARPVIDPEIGGVHPGFLAGVKKVAAEWDMRLGKDVIVAGHSLGAGHALVYAAHLAALGRLPEKIVVFGSPRPGFQKLSDLLAPVPLYSYRNQDAKNDHHDLVTDVPFPIYPWFPYFHPRQFIPVTALPAEDDRWGVFAWHHLSLYRQGLAAL